MDYDDNDFQGQNLQLAGDGSSKFSSVLQPYVIPKFEFDDGLPGHLRFDSLVENEVFLGIPSQEDNQWIEDFSRGSSGIEFSSGAAESCSIPRRHNVWSEATSSESVEMLLKSVGQEEMVPGETIIEESEVCEELDGLTDQMEPPLKPDDNVKSDMDSELAELPPSVLPEQFCRFVDGTSQTQEAEMSTHRSDELGSNVSHETCVSLTENNPGMGTKSDDANKKEEDIQGNESLDDNMQKDPPGSVMQIQNINFSSQDIAAPVQLLNSQELDHQVSDVTFKADYPLFEDTGKSVVEHHALIKGADGGYQNLEVIALGTGTCDMRNRPCSSPEMESIEKHAVETGVSMIGDPSSLPLTVDDSLKVAEGCREDLHSTDPENASKSETVDLSNSTETHQLLIGNVQQELTVAVQGENNLEGHAIEVNNVKAGMDASSDLKVDQAIHVEESSVEGKDCLQKSDQQLDSKAVSTSDASLLSGMDNRSFDGQCDGDSSDYVRDFSSSTIGCSSSEMHGENHTVETSKGADYASGVNTEDLNAEGHVSSLILDGSIQTREGNLVSNPNDVHNSQGVSSNEKVKAKLPNSSLSMDSEILESLSSSKISKLSSQGEGTRVDNQVVHGLECVTAALSEPDFDVPYAKTNSASHDTANGVSCPAEAGATLNQVNHQDRNKKAENQDPAEARLPSSMENLEGASEHGPDLNPEKGESHSPKRELAHEAVNQSLPTVETSNSTGGNEQSVELLNKRVNQSLLVVENPASGSEEVKAKKNDQNSSNKLEACPILQDSAVKDSGSAEGVVPGNHEEVVGGKHNEALSSKIADETLVANKSEVLTDPTLGTLSKLHGNMDQNDHEGNEVAKEPGVTQSRQTAPNTGGSVNPNCDIPAAVSGTVLCQSEKDMKETVKVSLGPSERESGNDGQSVTGIQISRTPTVVEGSPLTPSSGQVHPKIASGVSKKTPERKTRRASARSTGKENAKKGNHVKETTNIMQSEGGDKACSLPLSFAGSSQLVQFEGMKAYANVERGGAVPCGIVSIPTSNLPDLNTSAPMSALFQQPFTDLQQVQLRAQIFVYGSLIQGAVPDEACMVSAFGASDGGRSAWEPAWRACVDRIVQSQKSHPNKSETPVQSRSGARLPDQSVKQSGKAVPPPLGRASGKGTPSSVANSMIPLSSPLWNMPTPSDGLQSTGMPRSSLLDYQQTVSPLHPFQTPSARSFVAHSPSWLSQAPFPGPWVPSPQTSTFDASARFSVFPITETVKLTPIKEPAAPVSSEAKHASPSTLVHGTSPGIIAGNSSLPEMRKLNLLPGQDSTDVKSRKRKKVAVSDSLGQIPMRAQTRTESVSAPVVSNHLSTSVVVSTPSFFPSKGNAGKVGTAVSPTTSVDHNKGGEQNAALKVTTLEETFNKVEEAKRQAEDAAALAATAVSHSQSVWSELDKQKNSGLVPGVEAKLASAAVAAAAAASVAKAAAAAAKIASDAALQAKLMADEALTSCETSNPAQGTASSLADVVNNLGKATPASILKGGDGGNSSSSIIVAAREAARRRIEAASAASKHAENLDAIVKAAELAAEAISQAGKILAMGDPLPLNELVEAGPEGYWKVIQVPPDQGIISYNDNRQQSKVANTGGLDFPARHAKAGPSEEAKTASRGLPPLSREYSSESTENRVKAVDRVASSFTTAEKDSRGQRSRRTSDLAKTIGVIPESEIGPRSASIKAQDEYEKGIGALKENNIKEGCLVEVRKDGDEFKTAWFSANVLSLKDGKVFVSYTDLQSDAGRFEEWVVLEGEANSVPKIRIAHPMTTIRFEGTRKRRRAAMGDHLWSAGDKVDVWMQNCWREGIVTEKNQKDDTTLTVHFPAEGETSVVKAWHLRPTFIWNDGQWINWFSTRQKDSSSQGDTPQEKRLKLGIPAVEGREMDKVSKSIELGESGEPDEPQLLPLSSSEKIFNVGKRTVDENKPNAVRTVRSGLQKEGSKVIFGVPKPGKKRKFMEVSKHYDADRSSKTIQSNDSAKIAKYLMPQGSGSRAWKSSTKIDAKEKQAAMSKNKVPKSGKAQNVPGRTLPQKDKGVSPAVHNDDTASDHIIKDSVNNKENELGHQSMMESESLSKTEGAVEGPILFSSLSLPLDAPSKKMSSNVKTEQVNRGKFPPPSGKLAKVEVKDKHNVNPGKSVSEVVEPRRSNRRIQPTSRLLEGLQSSLLISKIPAVSHDKSHRSQSRGASRGSAHG
ncbi:uncharacterized protein LOC127787201 isoform X2 [Diospyros lotus]|uniref:uncharacterized protein LOC127787201 isoform X2 n=1 Tax=Diospyros lotus TaxID=55363 RepID=UPI0022572818|nr:uncharacterized protein LOC127787201 isoform X2 [Diospyros lotus]